ncbi:MAG: amino acid ABC transporter permease [Aestuariivita sp.]|nr:amino acid ABC transporter permease [Aestuariivita sp.]
MLYALTWLRNMRASNLMFLFAAPVIIYLITTSRNYGPAIKAVLGIEENPWILLASFLVFIFVGACGFWSSLALLRSTRPDQIDELTQKERRRATIGFSVQAIVFAIMSKSSWLSLYIVSIAVNSGDPRSVDWIIVVNNIFELEPTFEAKLISNSFFYLGLSSIISAACTLFTIIPTHFLKRPTGLGACFCIFFINFSFTFYFLMMAHAGFSVGLMVTLRAAFFAYIGASILGLIWAFCGRLQPSITASKIMTGIGLVAISVSIFFAFKPVTQIALVGELSGRIGIIKGTPQGITDTIRYGDFLEIPPDKPFKIRSLKSQDQAMKMLEQGTIMAAVLTVDQTDGRRVLWQTSYLPPKDRNIATACLVIGALSLLLVLIGKIITAHPLAVFSDFFVDTIRGIPMLVIILYVGLPLAGAIKSASSGYLDMAMMTRGILAIAIGYSAYMAEIFRAGIEAVPKGQMEAARTLGLREWQIARLIVIPQAIAIVLPALGNEFIAMLKDTSLVSILSVRDLTQRMREFQAQSFLAFEPFNSAALIYVFLTIVAASGIKALDNIVNKSRENES